ncbi:hypothetical protein BpsS140_00023 [Bacillus phage vB_BpsS-140]|nr:hypothetical protein BpsS140_00023 [Bacillus phage vB_BpsS-140]
MIIDHDYYRDDYGGHPIDESMFNTYSARAQEVVDEIAGFVLSMKGIDHMSEYVQSQVKKAISSQIEYFALNGGYEVALMKTPTSVSAGKYSYTINGDNSPISSMVFTYLIPTGLLYRGVNT